MKKIKFAHKHFPKLINGVKMKKCSGIVLWIVFGILYQINSIDIGNINIFTITIQASL